MNEHTERSWNVALRSTGADTLEIAVYDVIGHTLFEDGFTAKDLLGRLRAAPSAKKISLRVNSIGGLVDDAKAMANLLGERAAAGVDIEATVDGIAASSASYLLTAANRVVMPANTFQMLHGVRGAVRGQAKDLDAAAQLMRRMSEQFAEAYAAASARRGKNKTKEDFLAAFESGDTYLDADEAIEWGLADEKLEALKVAACLVDLTELDSAPMALRSAPYVLTASANNPKLPAPRSPEPPEKPEETNMEIANIIKALGLPEDADEATVIRAIGALKVSARAGGEIERLVGAIGDQAIGAVRALKESQTANAELTAEVAKVKVAMARRDFEGSRDAGLKDRKLTPAVAKMYTERFEAALVGGEDGSSVVGDLQGFLKVAPRIASAAFPPVSGQGSDPAALQHNGKTFDALTPWERHQLKGSDLELYNLMRADWKQSQAH